MLLSFRWLKEFLRIKEEPSSIADLLTRKGISVENIIDYGEKIAPFRVAEVQEIDDGNIVLSLGKEEYKVEKWPGLKVKDKVGFSKEDKRLFTKDLLGIGNEVIILDPDFPVGARLSELLDDYVLELEITSNRGDLLSVLGIARELSWFLDCEMEEEKEEGIIESEPRTESQIKLTVEDRNDCPSYLGRIISDVEIRPSPFSLQWRLFISGIRPHSNVVDATNYILLKYGQPLHPFDLNRIFGEKIIVRRAKPQEKIKTIDGIERELTPDLLVIADSLRPIAIAGIMGGANTEIVGSTKRVFLECAHFSASVIRKGSLSLRLITEASRRFELGIDEANLKRACDAGAHLIASLSGGKVNKGIIGFQEKIEKRTISFTPEEVKRILGVSLSPATILRALKKAKFAPQGKRKIKVQIPSYRKDIKEEIDLIEELARFYGYENIPADFSLSGKGVGERDRVEKRIQEISLYLAHNGFYEVKTPSFTDESVAHSLGFPDFVKIKNPLRENLSILRPSLLTTILPVISHNFRNNNKNLRLFEIGKVFKIKEKETIGEEYNLALVLSGAPNPLFWQKEKTTYDFFDLKGIFTSLGEFLSVSELETSPANFPFFAPGEGAEIKKGERIGYCGRLKEAVLKRWDIDTPVWFGEISLESLLLPKKRLYRAIPAQFPIVRDFSFLLEKRIPAQAVRNFVQERFRKEIVSCEIFDCFTGPPLAPEEKNLGLRITLFPKERTEEVFAAIISEVEAQFSAKLRSRSE